MQIEPIQTQSVSWTTTVNGARTEIVRKEYTQEGNTQRVSETHYYLYNSHGLPEVQASHQVDLYV
jgi:hypothetical protein